MKALMIRTGSVPVHSFVPGSPDLSLSSRSLSLHLDSSPARGMRRALSDPDVARLSGLRSHSFSVGSMSLDCGDWPGSGTAVEEMGFPGGGIGKGRKSGSGGSGDAGGGDRRNIGDHYQEMLRSNPSDSLLLANYAKFLHEVEGDAVKAGEYYGRAILANPSDGEVLSLYGKLIWETERDGERAKAYFDRALRASPDNSAVYGLYAHFMWEADEDEDDGVGRESEVSGRESEVSATLIEAF